MKYIAAYLLLVLGGNNSPSKTDLIKVLEAAKVEVDNSAVEKLWDELEGKDVNEVIEQGKAKLTSGPVSSEMVKFTVFSVIEPEDGEKEFYNHDSKHLKIFFGNKNVVASTKGELVSRINLAKDSQKVVVWYSGHGRDWSNSEGIAIPFVPEFPTQKLCEMGRDILIVFDCCFTYEAMGNDGKQKVKSVNTPSTNVLNSLISSISGITIVSSCSRGEETFLTPSTGSIFTLKYLHALEKGLFDWYNCFDLQWGITPFALKYVGSSFEFHTPPYELSLEQESKQNPKYFLQIITNFK